MIRDDLADVTQFAGHSSREIEATSGPRQGHGRPFFQAPLCDTESQRVIGQDSGDEDSVIRE